MGNRRWMRITALLLITLVICSCSEGRPAFLTVQLCLRDDEGVSAFKSLMQAIARREGMEYTDSSAETQRELRAIGARGERMHAQGGLIYVGVLNSDNSMGLLAGNQGLNRYDIAVGFLSGRNPAPSTRARQFSNQVVKELKQQWPVKTLPPNSGAFPDPGCNYGPRSGT